MTDIFKYLPLMYLLLYLLVEINPAEIFQLYDSLFLLVLLREA